MLLVLLGTVCFLVLWAQWMISQFQGQSQGWCTGEGPQLRWTAGAASQLRSHSENTNGFLLSCCGFTLVLPRPCGFTRVNQMRGILIAKKHLKLDISSHSGSKDDTLPSCHRKHSESAPLELKWSGYQWQTWSFSFSCFSVSEDS